MSILESRHPGPKPLFLQTARRKLKANGSTLAILLLITVSKPAGLHPFSQQVNGSKQIVPHCNPLSDLLFCGLFQKFIGINNCFNVKLIYLVPIYVVFVADSIASSHSALSICLII